MLRGVDPTRPRSLVDIGATFGEGFERCTGLQYRCAVKRVNHGAFNAFRCLSYNSSERVNHSTMPKQGRLTTLRDNRGVYIPDSVLERPGSGNRIPKPIEPADRGRNVDDYFGAPQAERPRYLGKDDVMTDLNCNVQSVHVEHRAESAADGPVHSFGDYRFSLVPELGEMGLVDHLRLFARAEDDSRIEQRTRVRALGICWPCAVSWGRAFLWSVWGSCYEDSAGGVVVGVGEPVGDAA